MDVRVRFVFDPKANESTDSNPEYFENAFVAPVIVPELIPDIILPMQFYARSKRNFCIAAAEGRLMLAVLEDAVNCYVRNMHRTNRRAVVEFREVNEWFNSRDSLELFAFENICEVLGVDAGWIRRGLRVLYRQTRRPTRVRFRSGIFRRNLRAAG